MRKTPRARASTLAVCGMKGGGGKSTLALAVAAEAHARGVRTLVVDADDEQRTAAVWADVADERGHDAPPVIALGDNLRSTLPGLAGQYELVVVDTPGRNGRRAVYALGLADLALLPCGPSGPDLWAMSKTLEQLRDVQAVRGDALDARIVITRKQPGTVLGRRARVALDAADVGILDTEITYRIGYGEAITAGLAPTTYEPTSEAAAEVRRLVDELERLGFVPRSSRRSRRLRSVTQ